MFVAVLLAVCAGGARRESTGAGMWLGFAVSQVYLLARLWVRLVFFASETALFQGRLAHAGYIAGAPVAVPEPPIVGARSIATTQSRLVRTPNLDRQIRAACACTEVCATQTHVQENRRVDKRRMAP